MGQTPSRKYPYPNPTGDGADVSYWAQRLAAAIDTDVVAVLASVASVVSSAASNLTKITALTGRATAVEGRATALEARTPFKMHAGITSINVPSGFAGSNSRVTFPGGGFDVAPIITASIGVDTAGEASKLVVHLKDIDADGFRLDLGTSDNKPLVVPYTLPIHWHAVQMKSGAANG
jgi:hypothetical protein